MRDRSGRQTMFEKPRRGWVLSTFILASLFLMAPMGIVGLCVGALSGYASLSLLCALVPQMLAAYTNGDLLSNFTLFGGIVGAIGGVFLTGRYCLASLKESDTTQDAREIDSLD